MAASDLGVLGSNSTKTAGTTLQVINQSGAIIPAGTLIFINFGCDNIASVTAPTLTVSNVGGVAPTSNHAAVGSGVTTTAGSGVWHQCWRVLTTADIADTTAITTVTSNQSNVVRAVVCRGWSGATATLQGAVVTATSTAGTPSAVSGVTTPLTGNVVVGSIVGENNAVPTADADTLNGSWSSIAGVATTGGSAATNITVGMQSKIVTAGGAQTYNPVTSADAVACITCVTQTPAPGVASAPTAVSGEEVVDVTTPAAYPSNATSWIIRYGIDGAPNANATGAIGLSAAYQHTGGDPTKAYAFLMRATGVGGTTDGTASTGVYPNPKAPTFTLTPGSTTIDVNIDRRAYAAKYKVYRRVTSVGGAYTLVHTSTTQVASGTYNWQDTGLTNGTSYDYVVSTEAQTPTVRESTQSTLQAMFPAFTSAGVTANDGSALMNSTLFDTSVESAGSLGGVSYRTFFRMPNITVAAAATITSATLNLWAQFQNGTPDVSVYVSTDSNPAAPTTAAQVVALTPGTANVNLTGSFTSRQFTLDVTALIQEVVDRAGWASGNALMFIIEDNLHSGSNNTQFAGTTAAQPIPTLLITAGAPPPAQVPYIHRHLPNYRR